MRKQTINSTLSRWALIGRDMSSLLAPDDGVAVVASDKPTDFIEAGWKLVSGFRDVPDVPQWLELHGAK
jgi:hypothetical protein